MNKKFQSKKIVIYYMGSLGVGRRRISRVKLTLNKLGVELIHTLVKIECNGGLL
jgi:hypothetical protein